MADTVDRAERMDKHQEVHKKNELLEKMKDLLGNLREKYAKATAVMKHSIQQQMLLIKKRFNKVYQDLHGEPYYSVASDDALLLTPSRPRSTSADAKTERATLKELQAKIKHTPSGAATVKPVTRTGLKGNGLA